MVPRAPDKKDTPMIAAHCLRVSFLNAFNEESIIGVSKAKPKICSQNTTTDGGRLYKFRLRTPSRLHSKAAVTTAAEPYLIYFKAVSLSAANATVA